MKIFWVCLLVPLFYFGGLCKRSVGVVSEFRSVYNLSDTAGKNFRNVREFGAIGDDVDDTKALQLALNSGNFLLFPKGIYTISRPLLKSYGAINIKAESGAVIKLAESFPSGATIHHGAFIFQNMISVKVSGLVIDGNRGRLQNIENNWRNYISGFSLYRCNNIYFDSCEVRYSPSNPFEFQSCINVSIADCIVKDYFGTGILFQSSRKCLATRNVVLGRGPEGESAPGGVGILATGSVYVNIIANRVDSSSDTGIKTEGCNDVLIEGNYVGHSAKDGIKFENRHGQGVGQPDIDIVFRGRIINNTVDKILPGKPDASCLIQTYAGQDVVIANNIVIGGSKEGLEDGIQIDQNPVFSEGVYSKNVRVYNNTVSNVNRFLYINRADDVIVEDNKFENREYALTKYNGVDVFESSNILIRNNYFKRKDSKSASGCGINISRANEIDILKNRIINADCGIVANVLSGNAFKIKDNYFENLGGYVLSVSTGSGALIDSVVVANNKFSRFGMQREIGFVFKIDASNLTSRKVDVSNNEFIGNGINGDYGMFMETGGNIDTLDVSDVVCTGNVTYPTLNQLGNWKRLIGWKSYQPPQDGYWTKESVVYNIDSSADVRGWICIRGGSPGVWEELEF